MIRRGCGFPFHPGFSWVLLIFLALGLASAGRAQPTPPVQPVSLISVLVLYTPQAAAGAGGTAAILGQINEAVVEANTVFQNSRVNARVWLVKAAEINYAESGSAATDLARLQSGSNSVFAAAHKLQDQSAADLVCLITETGNDWDFYGLQGPSAENAFSILRQPYLTGLNYFPVTLSFNFGCQLERAYADSAAAFPYAYGYTFWDPDDSTDYSTVEAFSAERLPFFSNPDIQYDGVAAGIPAGLEGAADNARVLNQTAPIVAAFRGTAVTTYPPTITLTSPAEGGVFSSGTNLPLTVAAADADGKVVAVDYYYDGTNHLATVGGAPFSTVWRNLPEGRHTLTAVATDNQHATTVSEPVDLTVLPTNDNFASRSRITIPVTIQEPNDLATAEPGEPANNGNPAANSLWWTWTAPADTTVAISVSSNSIPLNLSVYTGTNLLNLSVIAANSFGPASPQQFWFRAYKGMSYQITADGQYGITGEAVFTLTQVPSPPNDDFVHRILLKGNAITLKADNSYATHEPGEPDHAGTPGDASHWWSWTAPASGQVTIDAASAAGYILLAGV